MPVQRSVEQPLGVVYTPPQVTGPMVRVALAPLIHGKTAEQLAALRICDFAVGEGAFVREAIEQLATAIDSARQIEPRARDATSSPRAIAARCVVGVDVDARALAVARAATGCDLRVADALSLDWPAAFPDVFARGGFDAVIGNPPYVRQEWRADKATLDGFVTGGGVADLYVYFLELAHRILRPGGRYCVITPNKWLTVEYGRALRDYLTIERSVEGVVDLARLPVFAEADAFPCITWGTRDGDHDARGHRATGLAERQDAAGGVASALADRGVAIELGSDPWHIDLPDDRALIERLEARWPSLGDVLADRPARGVVTGCNRAFVVDGATRARLDDPLVRPFLKGRDIKRWRCAEPDRHVLLVGRGTDLEAHPAIAAHLAPFRTELEPRPVAHLGSWPGRKPGSYRWYELQDPVSAIAASSEPRLVYQDIQTSPACALLPGGVVPDTTVWILPTQDRYLLAVLNSSLYGWYATRRFPPALNGSVRPKLAYLTRLPIATPSPALRARIEALVEQRLDADDATLDAAIDDAVLAAYELTPAERRSLRER